MTFFADLLAAFGSTEEGFASLSDAFSAAAGDAQHRQPSADQQRSRYSGSSAGQRSVGSSSSRGRKGAPLLELGAVMDVVDRWGLVTVCWSLLVVGPLQPGLWRL